MDSVQLLKTFDAVRRRRGRAAAIKAVIQADRHERWHHPMPIRPPHRDPIMRGAVRAIAAGVARRHSVSPSLVRGRSRNRGACAARRELIAHLIEIFSDPGTVGRFVGLSPRAVISSMQAFEAKSPELARSISFIGVHSEIKEADRSQDEDEKGGV